MKHLMCSLFAAWLAGTAFDARAADREFVFLRVPGASSTTVWDINNLHQIAGDATWPGSALRRGFVHAGGAYTFIAGPDGAIHTTAMAISDTGVVAGSFATTAKLDEFGEWVLGPQKGYLYHDGQYTVFAVPHAYHTVVRGISPDARYVSGTVSGAAGASQGFVYDTVAKAYTLVGQGANEYVILQAINSAYQVAGGRISGAYKPGFVYDIPTGAQVGVELPGAVRTAVRTVDDAGLIAGWFVDTAGAVHGFVGPPWSYEVVDAPRAVESYIQGSNNQGAIVGNMLNAAGRWEAFVARPLDAR